MDEEWTRVSTRSNYEDRAKRQLPFWKNVYALGKIAIERHRGRKCFRDDNKGGSGAVNCVIRTGVT